MASLTSVALDFNDTGTVAWGTFTQAGTAEEGGIFVHLGFVPSVVYVTDATAAWQHTKADTAATSRVIETGAAATNGVTFRDDHEITGAAAGATGVHLITAPYDSTDSISTTVTGTDTPVLAADTGVMCTGFSLGTAVDGGNSVKVSFTALR